MIKRVHKVRRNIHKAVCSMLVAVFVLSAGNIAGLSQGGGNVYAQTEAETGDYATKKVSENMVQKTSEEPITVADENVKKMSDAKVVTKSQEISDGEESTSEQESTTLEETTPETTTPEVTTTESVTTPEATTTQPVTETTTTKLQPWGKNQYGQFVNGNKKVIKGATMKGIDVSHHQGKIDWKKVAASDVDYAIIRCGYGDNIKSQDDKYWEANVAGCEKYNIPYGVYIYSYATTVKQAQSEAEHVLRLIKGHTLNFPIYFDMEDAVQAKLTNAKRKEIANAFLNAIHKAGYECGVYANLNWWNNYIPATIADNQNWYKWVAQYNDNACTYDGTYQMWQCTSEGKVSGINGVVDINFWFGAKRDRSYNIKRYTVASKPKTVTAPKRVTIKSLKKGKKKATLKWKKVTGAKGYRIQYSTSKKFKKAKAKTTTKRSVVIKKLKSKKTYYFRVKAYKINSSNKKVYSKKWSKVKHTKIK